MKSYTKKEMASRIIQANPDIFIAVDTLIDDLEYVYKVRKIAKKIVRNEPYDLVYLNNLIKISFNLFGDSSVTLFKLIMTQNELNAIIETQRSKS